MCSGLSIYYQNVRGLRTKCEDFYISALSHKYDVIILVETWLNSTVYDHEFLDERYNVFRRDRSSTCSFINKREGGGVCIAVHKKLQVIRKFSWESECEDLWVNIKLNGNSGKNSLNICAVYVPPPLNHDYMDAFLSNFTQTMNNKILNMSSTILIGDFNLSNIAWEYDKNLGCCVPGPTTSLIESTFIDEMLFNNLSQCNRIINLNNRILDLLLTNTPDKLEVSKNLSPLLKLDAHHPALEIIIRQPKCNQSLKRIRKPVLNFNKSNYEAINEVLGNTVWAEAWNGVTDVDEMVSIFYSVIMQAIKNNTPNYTPHSEKYPVWFSAPLIKCAQEKLKFHKKYIKYKNPRDKLTVDILRNRYDIMLKICYKTFKENAAETIRTQPKRIWSFINSHKRNTSSLPNQIVLGDKIATGGQEICDLFSEYFHSVYDLVKSTSSSNSTSEFYESRVRPSMSVCFLSEIEIYGALIKLDTKKGAGLDNIPNVFLKECAKTLCKPLYIIYNKSLRDGIFPAVWKQARLTPIHKKDDVASACNYRPVSILPALGKVLESIVQLRIFWHIKEYIHPEQHGFLPKKSTASNLMGFVNNLSDALDAGEEVHAVYTDFSKAFDLIDHSLLLQKISAMGIHGSLLRWCESYLMKRSQLIMIRGYTSRPRLIPTGVPQGSHLGPLFFLIFVNDLTSRIVCPFKMYADDLKLYMRIKTDNDTKFFQTEIDKVFSWCCQYKMILNIDKCYHIKFSKKRIPSIAVYYLNNIALNEVSTIRDLGVTFDSSLNFRAHIDNIVKKATQLSGFISRQIKTFKDPKVVIPLYNSLVRSTLEYNSSVWAPTYTVHINRLERIQKRFLYQLTYAINKCNILVSYESRLAYHKLKTLSVRRKVSDIIFLYKVIHGLVLCPDFLMSIDFEIPRLSSRLNNRKTFKLPRCRTNVRQHSPLYRMLLSCNAIRSSWDIFDGSLASTKIKLKKLIN